MATNKIITENWLPVIGYEHCFLVSNLGRVKRHAAGGSPFGRVGRILTPKINHWGYAVIRLTDNAITKAFFVHRLVAAAFIGPRPKGYQVNHIDGDKLNNHPSNLEYVTPAENNRHCRQILFPDNADRARGSEWHALHEHTMVRGEASGSAKLTDAKVRDIRLRYAARGCTLKSLGKEYGVHYSVISDVINRKSWKHIE